MYNHIFSVLPWDHHRFSPKYAYAYTGSDINMESGFYTLAVAVGCAGFSDRVCVDGFETVTLKIMS